MKRASRAKRALPRSVVRRVKTPGGHDPPQRAPDAGAQEAGLVLTNTGEATVEVLGQGAAPLELAAGAREVLRPVLLRATGVPPGSSGPMVIAPRAALALVLRSGAATAEVTLDATSLRAQGALYGAPEILVLEGKAGRVARGDAVKVALTAEGPVSVLVVGRGPLLNLDLAIEALFRRQERQNREER